jgi:hypothetical protein
MISFCGGIVFTAFITEYGDVKARNKVMELETKVMEHEPFLRANGFYEKNKDKLQPSVYYKSN